LNFRQIFSWGYRRQASFLCLKMLAGQFNGRFDQLTNIARRAQLLPKPPEFSEKLTVTDVGQAARVFFADTRHEQNQTK
jgi:hypothetical protein